MKMTKNLTHIASSVEFEPAMTEEQLAVAGIPAGMVRISVGLESKDDLIADLAQALSGIEA